MDAIINSFVHYKQNLKNLEYVTGNTSFTYILVYAVIFMFIYWQFFRKNRKYKLPPGPLGVPILGYLPFLSKEPFRDFDKLTKKYGNVFSVYLGQSLVVVLGGYDVVKEAFSKSTTADRPDKLFDFMPDGIGIGSVNGEEWVEQRKYTVKSMRNLGLGRDRWESLVQDEVDDFIASVSKHEGNPIDISRLLTASVSNNISSFVFGKRFPLTDKNVDFICSIMESVFTFSNQTAWRHYFPGLCDLLGKFGISSDSTFYKEFEDFNNFIRREVELRKQVYVPGSTDNFIDGYLTEIKTSSDQNIKNSFNERNLCGNVQALYLAGGDTTKTSLTWLLLGMAKYLDVQEKVHNELDSVLGKSGKIQWTEKFSIPYTFAVIMEMQRWQTIVPLNTSRAATEDFKIGAYDIPKGTTIIHNIWTQHNDTKYWKNPEKFMPERFLLEDDRKINLKPDSYIPFSFGRRNCPGEIIAMMEILYYFVALMQNFKVLPPENEVPKMMATMGLTYEAVPQKLRYISRRRRESII